MRVVSNIVHLFHFFLCVRCSIDDNTLHATLNVHDIQKLKGKKAGLCVFSPIASYLKKIERKILLLLNFFTLSFLSRTDSGNMFFVCIRKCSRHSVVQRRSWSLLLRRSAQFSVSQRTIKYSHSCLFNFVYFCALMLPMLSGKMCRVHKGDGNS